MRENKNNNSFIYLIIPILQTIKKYFLYIYKIIVLYIKIRKINKIYIYYYCCCIVLLPITLLNTSNSFSYNISVKLEFIFKAFS